jgi:large subunit ribosomal protein L14
MIQKNTKLVVADNSGAKFAYCIHNLSKPNSRYAFIGDVLLVSVKQLRVRRRYASKIKKGELAYALVIRSNIFSNYYFGDRIKYFEPNVILFYKKTYKLIGTRIFGFLPASFRYSQFLRLLFICTGSAV